MARRPRPADKPGVRVFIDENLTPRLVQVGHEHGYDSVAARDRGMLGKPDFDIVEFCSREDRVSSRTTRTTSAS